MACFLVGCCLLTTFSATAQEVVHALCGTVRSINSTAKTITVPTDDGSEGLFKDFTKSNVSLDFDKRIRAEATTADAFTKNGVQVIVYYFGNSDVRTAVALQDLGSGPFEKSSGTVIKFHGNEHVLTLKNKSGVEETFHLSPKTVAETAMGAVEGYELDLEDGDQVRVTAAPVGGGETALFIGPSKGCKGDSREYCSNPMSLDDRSLFHVVAVRSDLYSSCSDVRLSLIFRPVHPIPLQGGPGANPEKRISSWHALPRM